jgi:D-sedoheptulose 7-phosphate isomerase
MSTDYWKNGVMRAIAFNDAALLTCLSNDCGYENVFGKSVEMFGDKGDILVAISSSGQSEIYSTG